MRTRVEFLDVGAQSVVMDSEIAISDEEHAYDKPTAAVVLAIATKAMFENGMLARAGQIAMEGISEGKAPAECILAAYEEKKNNDPDT